MINDGYLNKIFQVSATPSLVLHADDPVFTIAEVNQAFLKTTNSSRDDLLDKGIFQAFAECREYIPANSLLNLRHSFNEVITTGLPHKIPALHHNIENRGSKTFNEKYWEIENIPLFADNGTLQYILHIAIDITGLVVEQKKEEQRLKLLESVITHTKDAVVITEAEPMDEPGPRILYVNEAFTTMTGYTSEEVIGKTPRILQGPESDRAALKELGEALRKWQPCEITTINYRKNGEPFWINFSVNPVANEKGCFTHWIAVERDVSGQKKAEQEIVKATRLYALTSRINQAIIHAKNEQTLFEEVCRIVVEDGKFKLSWIGLPDIKNRKIKRIAGAGANGEDIALFSDYRYDEGGPIEKVLTGSDYSTVNDIEQEKNLRLYRYAIERGMHSGITLAVKKSGKVIGVFTIYATEKNIFNKAEIELLLEVMRNISFALDVFEKEALRTLSEQNLRRSEQRLTEAQALTKIGSWETAIPGLNVHWSAETHRIFETDPANFEPTHPKFLDFIPLADRTKVDAAFLNSLHTSGHTFIEHRIITAKGNEKVVIERWQVFHGDLGLPVRAIGTCQDITDAKAAELKLQQSEFRYRQIVETAQEGIWLIDENQKTIFVNRKMGMILEYEPEEIIGKDITFFMDDAEKKNTVAALARRRRGVVENLERNYITKSGRHIRTNISASPVYDAEGHYRGSLAMVSDITERKLAEEKLEALNKSIEESEKRYSNLFHGSPQPMWVFDPQTFKFQQVNKAAIAHYGYSEAEFLNMTILDIRPSDEIGGIQTLIRENQVKQISPYAGRFRHKKKSGEMIIVEIYSSSVTIHEKIYRSVIAIDVTESIQFEHKITNAIIKAQEDERYEIGTELHDNVCQILSTSLLNLGMLKESVPSVSGEQWYEQCKRYIVLASEEIRNLSHQLAPAFFDEITLEDTFWVLLNTFNAAGKYQLLVHFDQAFKEKATLDRDMQLNLFRILQEQLRNILKHANAACIEINLSLHYNTLVMTIADDGVGFDVQNMKKGIGLANMKRRAELFSGKLDIHASPGKGCEVVVEIPLDAAV